MAAPPGRKEASTPQAPMARARAISPLEALAGCRCARRQVRPRAATRHLAACKPCGGGPATRVLPLPLPLPPCLPLRTSCHEEGSARDSRQVWHALPGIGPATRVLPLPLPLPPCLPLRTRCHEEGSARDSRQVWHALPGIGPDGADHRVRTEADHHDRGQSGLDRLRHTPRRRQGRPLGALLRPRDRLPREPGYDHFGPQQTISTALGHAAGVYAEDLHDGVGPAVHSSSFRDHQIAAYENALGTVTRSTTTSIMTLRPGKRPSAAGCQTASAPAGAIALPRTTPPRRSRAAAGQRLTYCRS
jgi:hypothetical protein